MLIFGKLNLQENFKKIFKFVEGLIVDKKRTMHLWYSDVPSHIKFHVEAVSNRVQWLLEEKHKIVRPIPDMNEIYVSAPKVNNVSSDSVFYEDHIDGPFFFFPFCRVLRCIVAINENNRIFTVFPQEKKRFLLSSGDLACFDFNRTIHRIEEIDHNDMSPRVILKLHFLVCPTILLPVGKILELFTKFFDRFARWAFNYSKSPDGWISQAVAEIVLKLTKYEQFIERKFGRAKFYGFLMILYFLEERNIFWR